MRGRRGQTAVEYVGALLLVSVVIAAVAGSDVGGQIRRQMGNQACKVLGGECRTGGHARPRASFGRLRAQAAAKPPKETFHGVPLRPPPPPLQPGDGGQSGAWGSKDARLADRLKKQLAYRVADAAEAAGQEDAARTLRHYLKNSGDPLDIDPRRLLRDIPFFSDEAAFTRVKMVQDLQRRLRKTYDGTTTYAYENGTPWESVPSSAGYEGDNWFHAIGGFSYSYTARATATPAPGGSGPPTITVEYRLHSFDRYNWDDGKGVRIGPVRIGDGVLGDLNQRGLAKDYEVHGTTGVESVTVGLHQKVTGLPPSKPAGGRDGNRSDPGRDRGR
jgi:hypothetical protein